MSSGDESDTNDIVSERETQFIPRSDDDEVLWDVQEITAERGKKYRVKWVGIDPITGKPWAQSWVAKHDCTDKLVDEWKAKKRSAAGKKRSRTGTTSRTSGSSKRAGSSTSGKKTHPSTSKAKSSPSVEQPPSPPPKKSTTKRKRRSEIPATPSSGAMEVDEESELSRPHKKQKTVLEETLLPPMSTDEDEDEDRDALIGPLTRAKYALQKKVSPKKNTAPLDVSDEDDSSPPKAKRRSIRRWGTHSALLPSMSSYEDEDEDEDRDALIGPVTRAKHALLKKESPKKDTTPLDVSDDSSPPKANRKSMRRSGARSAGAAVRSRASDLSEESGSPHSKTKTKHVFRRMKRATESDVLSAVSQDEEPRPRKSKKKSTSKRKSPSKQKNDLSEEEVRESLGHAPSRIKPREDDSEEERVPGEESKGHPGNEAAPFSLLTQHHGVDSPASTSRPPHISILQVLPSARPRSPDLSPGARARLELFDRMTAGVSQPDVAPSPADVPEGVPDDIHFNYDDTHDTHDDFHTFDPPRLISPPPSKSKPKHSKLGTPNGLIVPETESSRTSQSQSRSFLQHSSPRLPPARDHSPRKPLDLPTISVIAASATSSSASPQDPFLPPEKLPPHRHHPSKRQIFKPVPQISPNTFRLTINARSHVTDSEAPPSSIESFTSPKRVDKGKQRAVGDDQHQISLSEGEGDGERRKRLTQRKPTDSELKKRGKELFDQVQLAREIEREKKKKPKRLKTVNDIVSGTVSSPPKGSPLPSISGAESTLEMRLEDVVDLSGGANSTTLDTQEQSETKPLSEEEKARLRIALRQEEEESTQEAMDSYPLPPVKKSEATDDEDVQMPPPRSPKTSPSSGQNENIDHVEQPSTDLQQVSVIVQASQEQRHEDTDIEPLPGNQPTSSPPRPIPENLTDSPKRRLGEALSLLNVKSEEIQRLERELANERNNLQCLKVELAEVRQSSEPTGPVLAAWEAERAQWTQERSKWENDFSEWQTERKEMSEERANLSERMAELSDVVVRAEEVRVKLEAERDTWTKERDAMLNDMTVRSEELVVLSTKVRREYDQDRSQWEIERASWVEEKARWETERATLQEKQEALLRSVDELTVKVESMTAAKISAEKDRDFFREQYAQASGFVGSVRKENMELEKRVEIAEGQAQEGIAGIKALFEGRVKALQADIDRWKGLTELLQEKDRRTNDELRLRAAQVPELRDLCGRLDVENKSLKVDVRKLEQGEQRSAVKRKKLYLEVFTLKKERASLRSKLSQLMKLADNSTQEPSHSTPAPPILEDPESMDPNDTEILLGPTPQSSNVSLDEPALFPCMWRPQWRDQCQQIFDTKEDLERHVQDHLRDLSTQ